MTKSLCEKLRFVNWCKLKVETFYELCKECRFECNFFREFKSLHEYMVLKSFENSKF